MSFDATDAFIGGVVSNCCGAQVLLGDMCADCGEHCEAECEHDWQAVDNSFDHAFGTQYVEPSYECQKCGETSKAQPDGYDAPDNPAELRADYLRDRAKDEGHLLP